MLSGADVPFGGLDDDTFKGHPDPKNRKFVGVIGISSQFCKKIESTVYLQNYVSD